MEKQQYEIVSQWESTSLLDELPANTKAECAYALQGQYVTNEKAGEGNPPFLRTSIPIVRRVFGHIKNLGGSFEALPEWLDTGIDFKPVQEDGDGFDLQKEADYTAYLAQELGKVIVAQNVSKLHCIEERDGRIWANVEFD